MVLALIFVLHTLVPDSTLATTFAPKYKHPHVGNLLNAYLAQKHYQKPKLNDELSTLIFDTYIENLDFGKSFFLQSDINEFNRYRTLVDDLIYSNNLQPYFNFFTVRRNRQIERYTYLLKLLKENEPSFSNNEPYVYDRENAPWFQTHDELKAYWKQQFLFDALNLKLASKEWNSIQETLTKRYENALKYAKKYNNEDVFQLFMNAFTTSVDPHTTYMSPKDSENFKIRMRLSLEGIGAQLRADNDYTLVVSVIAGGPASQGKELQENDRIIGVAQGDDGEMVNVIGWRLDDVVEIIRGKKGTVVRLEIIPNGATIDEPHKIIRIVRDKVKLEDQAAKSDTLTITNNGKNFRLGVIHLPSFYFDYEGYRAKNPDYKSTTKDVEQLLGELKSANVDGIIIDLRNNGGGSLTEAISMTGLFIKQGPVVQVKYEDGQKDVQNDRDPRLVYDGPIAVLVNRTSASASEIFSAAIQDYGRGIVVGTQTYGKGTVQQLIDLKRIARINDEKLENEEFGNLKYTTAKFYRINGGSTQHKGVIPDISFPSLYDLDEYGESAQKMALPWDQITPATYSKTGELKDDLSALEQRHRNRIKENIEYQVLLEEIEEADIRRNETSISLNIEARKQEREEQKARGLERKNKRRAAQGLVALKADETDDKKLEKIDPFLDETALILSDFIQIEQNKLHVNKLEE